MGQEAWHFDCPAPYRDHRPPVWGPVCSGADPETTFTHLIGRDEVIVSEPFATAMSARAALTTSHVGSRVASSNVSPAGSACAAPSIETTGASLLGAPMWEALLGEARTGARSGACTGARKSGAIGFIKGGN